MLVFLTTTGRAASTDERVRPEFVGKSLETEMLGIGVAGVGLTAVSLMLPQSEAAGPNTPHAFDRRAARRSDFTGAFVGVGLSLTVGSLLEASYLDGLEYEWLYTPLVAGESALYGFAVSSVLKRLVGRCRPANYDEERGCITDEAPRGSNFRGDEALRAWPSAHVMPVAGTAGAFLGTFVKGLFYGQPVRERLLASLVGLSLSAATMFYRVRAGAHSEDDVWSAFGMGNGIGIMLAWLHPMVRAGASRTLAVTNLRILPAADGFRVVGSF